MDKQKETNTKLTEEENLLPNQYFDKTVRATLSRKSEAVNFINNTLKLKGNNKVRETDIENYTTNFINKGMENRIADIIYKYKPKYIEGDIYFLIEHQTALDYSMPIRMIQYMSEILRVAVDIKKARTRGYKIPLIIPIILYTGKLRWTVGNISERIVKWEGSGYKEIKINEPIVIDVKDFKEEELLKDKGVLSKLLLIESKKEKEEQEEIFRKIINTRLNEQDKELLEIYVRHIAAITLGKEKAEELIKKIRNEKRKEENTMLADVIRDTWNSGEKAGVEKNQKQVVKSMLKEKLEIDLISRVTGMSKKEILSLV